MNKYLLSLALAAVISPAVLAQPKNALSSKVAAADTKEFSYIADRFADAQVLRYKVPGWETLNPKQKELVYYLYQAALSGRDMTYDQNYKHNLKVRATLEAVLSSFNGNRSGKDWEAFEVYAKRVFFSNGIHHHYSSKKFVPEISEQYLNTLLYGTTAKMLPLAAGENVKDFIASITPIILDANKDAKRVNLDAKQDLLLSSAMNYYEGVSQKEAENFYASKMNKADLTPISYGLNSKLVKDKKTGEIKEQVWKSGGMYGAAIDKIIYWLEKAVVVAENDLQKDAFKKLIEFYKTGDLKKFDEYSIAWVKDVDSRVDAVNGFIEVYGDPLGYRAAYESVVSIRDLEATKRIAAIGGQAQWFEDNSPIMAEHKKKSVKGISAKVITVVVESGDAAPTTPIGINLPNANWIRKEHGSKSVSLGNIVEAYDASSTGGAIGEFAFDKAEEERAIQFGSLAGLLHTDMHEVIGHASGQILAGVGTPKETLKNYANALEEGRADLVALYYMLDPKLVNLGVMPSLEVGKAEYDSYIRNGMMLQLNRIEAGEQIEEAHMRNRQMIAQWVFEKGRADNVIEMVKKGDKTYFHITNYESLRNLFGELLREVQRVISTGDYAAGQALIENYGVKVDEKLLLEVKSRFSKLNAAPYKGFIQPKLTPVMKDGKMVDVTVSYPSDFVAQQLEYGREYGYLARTPKAITADKAEAEKAENASQKLEAAPMRKRK